MNPVVHKLLRRKADNNNKCEVCGTLLGKRIDYLCEWCRGIKNLHKFHRNRPEDSAEKCSNCNKILNKEDLELSKILGLLICWKCKEGKKRWKNG